MYQILCRAKGDSLILKSRSFESASLSSFRKDNPENTLMSKDNGLHWIKINQKIIKSVFCFKSQDSKCALPAIALSKGQSVLAWPAVFIVNATSASPLRDYLILLCRKGILNKSGFIPILWRSVFISIYEDWGLNSLLFLKKASMLK